MTPVATSSVATFFDGLATDGIEMLLWALQYVFPTLLVVGVIYFFWRIVRSVVK